MSPSIDWRRCKQTPPAYSIIDIIADDTIKKLYPTRLVKAVADSKHSSTQRKSTNKKSETHLCGIDHRTDKKKKKTKATLRQKAKNKKQYKCSHCKHKTDNPLDYIIHMGREHTLLVCPWCISPCSFTLATADIATCNKCKKYLKFDDSFNYSNKPQRKTKQKIQKDSHANTRESQPIIKKNSSHKTIEIIFRLPFSDAHAFTKLHAAGFAVPNDIRLLLGLPESKRTDEILKKIS